MQMKSLYCVALIALAAVSLHGQNQVVYWSTTPPDCSSLMNNESPVTIKDASTGATLGYSCYVSGTFVWLAAGGVAYNPASWASSIRVSAPASGNIDADYTFYDTSGNQLTLDNTLNNDSTTLASSTETEVTLTANQPSEIELLGLSSEAPNYTDTAEGSVYATFYCPDATTCSNVLPQLIYSALPTYPWSLSVPIAWDDELSYQWSAVVDFDGGSNIGLVVYNGSSAPARYTVDVYDINGNFVTSGTTPVIQPLPSSGNLDAQTYADSLGDVVPGLGAGLYKILIDGGSALSAVEVLQITGSSATTLQVAFDTEPSTAASIRHRQSGVKTLRVHPAKRVSARTVK